MEENISIAEELGFSLQRILKCGYIIRNYPDYTKQTLKEFPTLAGYDIRMAMRSYPTLVVTPTSRIRKTYEVLKVLEMFVLCHMNMNTIAHFIRRHEIEKFMKFHDLSTFLNSFLLCRFSETPIKILINTED